MMLLRCLVLVGWMFCSVVAGAQSMGSVSGNVIDIDGVPAAGAVVTLSGEALADKRQVTLGADGRYSFVGVPAGKFSLEVTADGFAPAAASGVVLAGQDIA